MQPLRRLEYPYRVRFDEADASGRLRPSGILRYTQDVAWRHSEEAGFDREWYDARGMYWLVRNINLRIHASASHGDELSVSTHVAGLRQVWARRRTEVRADDRAGRVMAEIDTDWVLLGDDGRPARVPEEITRYFSVGETFRRSRVDLPEPPAQITTLSTRVRAIDLDPLGHMNNAAYLDIVDDALARMDTVPGRYPDHYRLGYVLPAQPGSEIKVASWPTAENAVACRMSDGEGRELTRVLVSWA
jgi:acyl-ACP thioesterase